MLKPSPRHLLRASPYLYAKPPPTHFTSTGPHAFAPPSSQQPQQQQVAARTSTIKLPKNVRPNETPRERVERLRAAARQARLAELPWQDKMIDRSRVVLDHAQRTFTIFLIGLSGVLAVITVYSVYDMISFNRKRTKEYNQQRQERNQAALLGAFQAVNDGTANIKQRVLIKRYEMVKEAEEERIRNRGTLARAAEWVVPGVMGRQSEARLVMKLDDDIIKSIESGDLPRFLDEVEESNQDLLPVKAVEVLPSAPAAGLLDRHAQEIATAAQSWLKWPWR